MPGIMEETVLSANGWGCPEKKQLTEKIAGIQGGSWVNQDCHFWEVDETLVAGYALFALQNCGVK